METREALLDLMAKEPQLTSFGFGIYNGLPLDLKIRDNEYAKCREELRTDTERISVLMHWLREHIRPRKTINRQHSSYGLKHYVERYFQAKGAPIYVPNGSFIAAALLVGYSCRRYPGSPNPDFGMSERSWTLIHNVITRLEGERALQRHTA